MQSSYFPIALRTVILSVTIALLVLGWPVLDAFLLDAIRSSYQLESSDFFNSFIENRGSYPLGHYLAKGRILSEAALMGAIAYLMLAFIVLTPGVFGSDDRRRILKKQLQWALLVVSLAAIALCVFSGKLHDYSQYVAQWSLVTGGEDPWRESSGNTYGPAYNLLAIPYQFNTLLPKILFCLAWLCCTVYIIRLLVIAQAENQWVWITFLCLALNPLFWTHTVLYGNFDVLVGVLCVIAVELRLRGKAASAGAILAGAVLFKYYPLAIAPFLMFDGRRLNRRFSITLGGVLLIGLFSSIAVWGLSTFQPLLFAEERASKLVSIFRFLRGQLSPLHWVAEAPDADFLSVPLMVLFGGLMFRLSWARQFRLIPAAILGILSGLTLYKVGHPQFLQVVVLLLFYWFARGRITSRENRPLVTAVLAYVAWLGFVSALYVLTGYEIGQIDKGMQGQWLFLRDIVGLPTFLLAIWVLVEIVQNEIRIVTKGVNSE